jgi:hypothetical protein
MKGSDRLAIIFHGLFNILLESGAVIQCWVDVN